MKSLRIATRKSPLALAQARQVANALARQGVDSELVPIESEGDVNLSDSLADAGGKGLFVKALEAALISGEADLAVHSLKDMPVRLPDGFALAGVCPRADARDAWVADVDLDRLPPGSRIGTSSPRRAMLIKRLHPQLEIAPLRGNVGTRLAKLDGGEYAGIVLACAGLIRLGLGRRIRTALPVESFIPAAGQGALALETLGGSTERPAVLAALNCPRTERAVTAERSCMETLGADCHSSVAAHALWRGDELTLHACDGDADHRQSAQCARVQTLDEARDLGVRTAEALMTP